MRSLGWALIQYDWCPYKKRKLGHRSVQREDDVKTQEEDSYLQVKERDLEQMLPSGPLEETNSAEP